MRKIPLLLMVAVLLTACGGLHRKGGYYQDDGPPKRRVDVAKIPDAVPRKEPHSQHGNNPYTVNGEIYYPLASANGYRQRGIASWYGKKFHGKRTSSGEPYDMYAMTAAHKTLPLPSYVRVRNLRTGRAVIVRVNDRGPFLQNRLIDLSYAAASKLDIIKSGTGLVEVHAIDGTEAEPDTRQTSVQGAAQHRADVAGAPRLYLQVGAFTSRQNATRLRARLSRARFGPVHIQSELQDNVRFYRVRIGPLSSIEETDRLARRAAEYGILESHVIVE